MVLLPEKRMVEEIKFSFQSSLFHFFLLLITDHNSLLLNMQDISVFTDGGGVLHVTEYED